MPRWTKEQLNAYEARRSLDVDKVDRDNHSSPVNVAANVVWEKYLETGSIHRAAEVFGVCGETARRLLISAGLRLNNSKWTPEELGAVRLAYSNPSGVDIVPLAKSLGRTHAAIACKANEIGITSNRGCAVKTESHKVNCSVAQKARARTPEEIKRRSDGMKQYIATVGHPKGFSGHKRTPEELAKMKAGNDAAWKDPSHRRNSPAFRQKLSDRMSEAAAKREPANAFSRARFGKRDDLGGHILPFGMGSKLCPLSQLPNSTREEN